MYAYCNVYEAMNRDYNITHPVLINVSLKIAANYKLCII